MHKICSYRPIHNTIQAEKVDSISTIHVRVLSSVNGMLPVQGDARNEKQLLTTYTQFSLIFATKHAMNSQGIRNYYYYNVNEIISYDGFR